MKMTIKKLDLGSKDMIEFNINELEQILPEVITEEMDETGRVKKSIDFDKFKACFSKDIVKDGKERYEFTWPGKKKAMAEVNKPVNKTLRPVVEDSKNWDKTANLYIEGDNLEVLKLLQESYLGQVKMIYIDPPYNTGTNLIYKNDFKEDDNSYVLKNSDYDDEGYKLVKNTDSNGRFHSDWCSMIYPVLKLSRNLLHNKGLIFIAMDDSELYSLKLICDEIMGERNYLGTIITRCNPQGRNKKNIDPMHEYHLVYAKNYLNLNPLKIKKDYNEDGYRNLMRTGTNSRKNERPNRFYPILCKNNKISMISKDEYLNIYQKNKRFDEEYLSRLQKKYEDLGYEFILPISEDGEYKVWQRTFDRVNLEYEDFIYDNEQVKVPINILRTPTSLWMDNRYSNVSNGTNEIKKLFNDSSSIFDFPKSIFTIKDLISLDSDDEKIVLDFFSGSATTAHAVMDLNAEDGGNRKFIMVNLPEETDENSEAYKAGYKNICEIGKERIRRAGDKILADNKDKEGIENLDTGFRVLRVDSTNMKDVYYTAESLEQNFLNELESNIKEDRTELDLLFSCLLAWGLPLDKKYKSENIGSYTIHLYNDGDLVACFSDRLSEDLIKHIAEKKPERVVFRDSCFKSSEDKINVEEIFKAFSPETDIRVL